MKNRKIRLTLRTLILIILAIAIIYTLYANFTKDHREVAAIGNKGPDFILKDLEGKEYKLSDLRGKGVFLNFWGTWCEPCKYEMPFMESQYQEYKDQGVEIIAVNVGETQLQMKLLPISIIYLFRLLLTKEKKFKMLMESTHFQLHI